MEVGVLRRILKRAKCSSAIADDIRPLKEPRSIGRALSHEQKVRLLHAADSNPEWQNARLAMTLALCTTMRGVEIKNLHWQHVDLLRDSFTVRRSKTDAGLRSIPMNADARAAVLELWERAKASGGTEPEHFLFPACEHGHINPQRCQKSWRTARRKLTAAAGIKGFRFHDCRHHANKELAESQASDSIIMALARARVQEDAGALQPCAPGSEARSRKCPLSEASEQASNRGLRHKERHKPCVA